MTFTPYKKLLLIVLDGFGIASHTQTNPITVADPTTINELINNFPATTLQASGGAVGLPWGENGNSEAGHLNMGAGRIIGQDLPRITLAIEDKTFFTNPAFLAAMDHVKKNNSNLHIMGMVSPGGIHSFEEHLYALIGLASEHGLGNSTFIHVFTDGEDSSEPATDTIAKLGERMARLHSGSIATIAGRFYAMDRTDHWNLIEQVYWAMVAGVGKQYKSAMDAIEDNYAQHIYEETIVPSVVLQSNGKPAQIRDNDAIIYFNYRADRAIEMTRAFIESNFSKFAKPAVQFKNLCFVTMAEYNKNFKVKVAFPPIDVTNGFAEIISKKGLRQFHIAESEKYAHVSVFFNGGVTNPFPGEDRKIVTSQTSNYQNYSKVPEMSARQVTDEVLARLGESYSFFLINFANPDMVGHTGDFNASVEAIKVIDECLKKISEACLDLDICLLISADHGNVEELLDVKSGNVDKEHSTNPVPFIVVANHFKRKKARIGGLKSLAGVIPVGVLSDVAPTMLELMGIEKSAEMTGVSLVPAIEKLSEL